MDSFNLSSFWHTTDNPVDMDYFLHIHDQYEIFCFLSGDISFLVEGTFYRMRKGDILIMRCHESHKLILNSHAPYERIVIHFHPDVLNTIDPKHQLLEKFEQRPLGQYNIIRTRNYPDNRFLDYLKKIVATQEPQIKLLYLLPLLNELSEVFPDTSVDSEEITHTKGWEVVSYINQHLFDNLSLENICQQFYLSKSQVNRLFRRSTGTTVWKYILVKRLHAARSMLINGERPSTVCEKCGFQNYVSFYKAYRQEFGENPHHKPRKLELRNGSAVDFPEVYTPSHPF